jgi:galactokinase/mevalonate kinase-like predicted kinase
MVISRTPLRVSFVGGGTDLPSFSRERGGAVLSTAIDKHIYVIVSERFVDNGSDHRGKASIKRLQGRWPTLTLVHLPVHAS